MHNIIILNIMCTGINIYAECKLGGICRVSVYCIYKLNIYCRTDMTKLGHMTKFCDNYNKFCCMFY